MLDLVFISIKGQVIKGLSVSIVWVDNLEEAVKVFQNGRPDTSACEDITPRNLCIHSILVI